MLHILEARACRAIALITWLNYVRHIASCHHNQPTLNTLFEYQNHENVCPPLLLAAYRVTGLPYQILNLFMVLTPANIRSGWVPPAPAQPANAMKYEI